MKLMIASDIHGSARWCRAMLDVFRREGADRLLLLGDLLYHGPRNDLPDEYAPREVTELLNGVRDRLFCVRGNCDAEVDQMVLHFPILAEYAVFPVGERLLYAAHGHHACEETPPPLGPGDILLCGHTHVPACAEHEGFLYLNPGSVALPKAGTPRSFMTLEGGTFRWTALETGERYREYTV